MKNSTLLTAVGMLAAASSGTEDLFYFPRRRTVQTGYCEPVGIDLARAKGLVQFFFEDSKFIYARNEKEALKRARKRGYDIAKIHTRCDTE